MKIEKLQHLSVLEISGEDATDFLQGQLTNDVKQLDGKWQYSGYCNPKGRLLALLQMWRNQEKYYALIDSSLSEATIKRLRMYVMRSKVEISEIEHAEIVAIDSPAGLAATWQSLFGDKEYAEFSARQAQANVELGDNPILHTQELSLLAVDQYSLLVRLSTDREIEFDEEGQYGEFWNQSEIAAGRPSLTSESTELFIPQMLNLDVLHGINFKKGCYTGQEIVARMHYLGKLKQRMFVCETDKAADLAIGQKVFGDTEHQKSVGTLANVNTLTGAVLAVLRLDAIQAADEREATTSGLFTEAGQALRVLRVQPYNLPE